MAAAARCSLVCLGEATTARGMLLSESVCFAPERWNELDRTRHHVGGWAGHSATVYQQDQVILFGGLQADTAVPSNRLCRLDAASGEFIPMDAEGTPPSPRWCHSSAMLTDGGGEKSSDGGASMVIFGGWRYPQSVFLNDMHLLNLGGSCGTTSRSSTEVCPSLWTRVMPFGVPPVPRCQSSMVVLDGGLLLVFGGACHAVKPTSADGNGTHADTEPEASDNAMAHDEDGDNSGGGVRNDEREEEEEEEEDGVAYGDHVVDLADVQLFDLKAQTWLRCESSYAPLRGGVNAMFRCDASCMCSVVCAIWI